MSMCFSLLCWRRAAFTSTKILMRMKTEGQKTKLLTAIWQRVEQILLLAVITLPHMLWPFSCSCFSVFAVWPLDRNTLHRYQKHQVHEVNCVFWFETVISQFVVAKLSNKRIVCCVFEMSDHIGVWDNYRDRKVENTSLKSPPNFPFSTFIKFHQLDHWFICSPHHL